jgi:hypothetical protein
MAQFITLALATTLLLFALWATKSRSLAAIRLRARLSLPGMDPCKDACEILLEGDFAEWGIHGVEDTPEGFSMSVFLLGRARSRSQLSMEKFFLGYGELRRNPEDPRYVDCFIARKRVEQWAGRQDDATTSVAKSPEPESSVLTGGAVAVAKQLCPHCQEALEVREYCRSCGALLGYCDCDAREGWQGTFRGCLRCGGYV